MHRSAACGAGHGCARRQKGGLRRRRTLVSANDGAPSARANARPERGPPTPPGPRAPLGPDSARCEPTAPGRGKMAPHLRQAPGVAGLAPKTRRGTAGGAEEPGPTSDTGGGAAASRASRPTPHRCRRRAARGATLPAAPLRTSLNVVARLPLRGGSAGAMAALRQTARQHPCRLRRGHPCRLRRGSRPARAAARHVSIARDSQRAARDPCGDTEAAIPGEDEHVGPGRCVNAGSACRWSAVARGANAASSRTKSTRSRCRSSRNPPDGSDRATRP